MGKDGAATEKKDCYYQESTDLRASSSIINENKSNDRLETEKNCSYKKTIDLPTSGIFN